MLERLDITDRRAAAALGTARSRRILLALVDQERSLSELAQAAETPLNLLHHHVGKLRRLGLVEVVREQRRGGSPIKFYRAAARSFFVPAELATRAGSEGPGGAAELRKELEAALAAAHEGVLYFQGDRGPRMRVIGRAEPAMLTAEFWLVLRLDRDDAAALRDELEAVARRYVARSRPTGRRTVAHLALARR